MTERPRRATNRSRGVASLARGVANLARGVTNLARGVTNLARGVAKLARGVTHLARGEIFREGFRTRRSRGSAALDAAPVAPRFFPDAPAKRLAALSKLRKIREIQPPDA